MRWRLLLLVGGLAPLAGCHLVETAAHNAVNEPAVYLDERHVTHELRHEAKQVVKDLRKQQAMSEDYEDGFVDGYADALERGGQSLPPAVPPTKYRRGRFLNPNGHARIYDYFAGFQQGAECAAASGKRQFLTVPVLLADPPAEQLPPVTQVPREQCGPNAVAPNCPVPPVGGVKSLPPAPAPTPPATKPPEPEPRVDARPEPTATELASPKRPLLATPLVPPPAPGPDAPLPGLPQVMTQPPPEAPPPEGVVTPRPEPQYVVPPQPEPRK